MGRLARAAAPAALAALLAGCAHTLNYVDPVRPRYEGRHAVADPDPVLRVVSFNVKLGRHVERAVRLLRETPELRDADLIALQEMDARGVDRMARELGYDYVYYPAVYHPMAGQDMGNALLSRWPMEEDRKIILPELHRFRRMHRIAVAATVRIGGLPVRAYSVHLETMIAIEGPQRRRQLEPILADAARHRRVVMLGDFNNRNQVGRLLTRAGYLWLTEKIGPTISLWSWDHIFVRGLQLRAPGSVGKAGRTLGASDHRPVWAELQPPEAAAARASRPSGATLLRRAWR